MRFFENGPSIPDDLLVARDQGRVVFFCGAGVSRAKAKLPDFFGLAESVTRALGVAKDSSALKVLNKAQTVEEEAGGVPGLISADRVFGLLEREFDTTDIQKEVALALKPNDDPDLSAHSTLLDLATTPEGRVRLVTTNFDLLFDNCGQKLPSWQPPRLPDPNRPNDIHGIVYLHGKVTCDYQSAEGDGFILSTSEFGRAYLSEGWATTFFRQVLEKYVVVFVGYKADDPPVHYLLEALNKSAENLQNIYAFHRGDSNDAAANWGHKGVKAIPYREHPELWETLDAWASRARDPDQWYSNTITKAANGPEELMPHERGQITHIASTADGAKRILKHESLLPASWLCVFDSHRRYASPSKAIRDIEKPGPYVDPFDLYGIDSDIPPKKIDPDDHHTQRQIPSDVWDGFSANRLDRLNLSEDNLPLLRGAGTGNPTRLSERLMLLGLWIGRVASQPTALWWASYQGGLHPSICDSIRESFHRSKEPVHPDIHRAWHNLFECWESSNQFTRRDSYLFESSIEEHGWYNTSLREYGRFTRPYLTAKQFWRNPIPPSDDEARLNRPIDLDVNYPDSLLDLDIADKWLAGVVAELRKNLEIAIDLEKEVGGYRLRMIDPILLGEDLRHSSQRDYIGLSRAVIFFAVKFKHLVKIDLSAAIREFAMWPTDDNSVFGLLRIWAAEMAELVPDDQAISILLSLEDEVFWDYRYSPNILRTLNSRWNNFDTSARTKIEARLLAGPQRYTDEKDEEFNKRKAYLILGRIHWLSMNGCDLLLDIDSKTKELKQAVPGWQQEGAIKAAEPVGGQCGGFVKNDTECAALLEVPLSSVLATAQELSDKNDDLLTERNPFEGLCEERPVRAFSALRIATGYGDIPKWAWDKFLHSSKRKDDKPKFIALVAERLVQCSDDDVCSLIRPVAFWLSSISKHLAEHYPETHHNLISHLTRLLPKGSCVIESSIIRRSGQKPDWIMETINAPAGRIAGALFDSELVKNIKPEDKLPGDWSLLACQLFGLSGDAYKHVLTTFTMRLSWLFYIDEEWTEKNILIALNSHTQEDTDAFWAGFLRGRFTPGPVLAQRIKPSLLNFAKSGDLSGRRYSELVASSVLSLWISIDKPSKNRFLSNDELRDVLVNTNDEFRSHILWLMERWISEADEQRDRDKDLLDLLRNIWPRQKSVKTPTMSARLFDLAFANHDRFVQVADLVLPLLTKIDSDHLTLHNLRKEKEAIVKDHPKRTLALLYAALPDHVSAWPYYVDEVINLIEGADESLSADSRLIELKRKWDSR